MAATLNSGERYTLDEIFAVPNNNKIERSKDKMKAQ